MIPISADDLAQAITSQIEMETADLTGKLIVLDMPRTPRVALLEVLSRADELTGIMLVAYAKDGSMWRGIAGVSAEQVSLASTMLDQCAVAMIMDGDSQGHSDATEPDGVA